MLEVNPQNEEATPVPVDLETLFGLSGVGLGRGEVIGGDFYSYEDQIEKLIDDAIDFEESYLSTRREENMAYYQGFEPALPTANEGEERPSPNRSTFISTDVRDTILTILPSLIRIFMSSERIANFVPTSEAGQDMADMAYDYCNYVFYNDNEGFLILHAMLKDALIVNGGIVSWYTDNAKEMTEQVYQNIDPEQYETLMTETDQDIEVVDFQQSRPEIIDEVRLRFEVSKPLIRVEAVPPEEFRISKTAKSVKDARLVGREWIVTPSFLVAKGIPPEALEDLANENQMVYSDERYLRNPALADSGFTNRGILYGDYYIRIDKDGDGIDELRHICTVGSAHIIIMDDVVQHKNYALWNCDPRPHTALGDSVADLVKDIQRIKTNMIRGQMDNLAEMINPRTVVNELLTNIEDVLSDEVGNIIRTRGDPNTAVAYTRPIYAGAEVQESINYLDQVRASRTGVTEASKGLDPKAMQSTALAGIDAIVSGAQERIELIARILAQTGFKDMMEGILREVVNNPNPIRNLKLRGKWQKINPSLFDPSMSCEVNPTMGKGSDMLRLQVLAAVKEDQAMIISKFGIANAIVTPQHYMNTVQDMMEIGNVKNFTRYFAPITSDIMESIQNAPREPDPTEVLAQAEMEKVKASVLKTTSETEKNQQDTILKAMKQKQDDDFRRDELNINSMLEVASIFGEQVTNLTAPDSILALNQPAEGTQ